MLIYPFIVRRRRNRRIAIDSDDDSEMNSSTAVRPRIPTRGRGRSNSPQHVIARQTNYRCRSRERSNSREPESHQEVQDPTEIALSRKCPSSQRRSSRTVTAISTYNVKKIFRNMAGTLEGPGYMGSPK
jgi:hypothetical protein